MRKKRNVNRLLTAILTMVMLITTVAQSGTVAYASEYFEDAIVEVSVSDEVIEETIDISEEGIGEAVENSNEVEGEEKSDLEQIVESEIATENSILPEAEEIVEEESFEEIEISEEAMYASTVINIYSDTASIDNMASEGWCWDLESATLTLDGADLSNGFWFYRNATINVLSDSTINGASNRAIFVTGQNGKDIVIQGSGTLHLITESSLRAALGTNNDTFEHNITITGSSLTVDCVNDSGYHAIMGSKLGLTVTDGATLNASVNSNNAAIQCLSNSKIVVKNGGILNATKPGASFAIGLDTNNELDVIDGGKINVSNGEGNAIYASGENAIINILGKGSVVTANYTDTSRPSSAAISAGSTGNITITDGGKLVCNNVSPHSTGLIYAKDVDVDIRGGIIEAHTAATKVFGTGASMVLAKSVNYNEGAANNAYYDGSASYKVIHINKSADHFLYADLIQFTSVPKSSMGVKTGNTLELSVDTEVINTDEIPVITYQWYKDGAKIVGATDATYETPALSDGKYTYKCEVQATFTVGTVTLSTEDIKVFVNAQGRTTADKVLSIDNTTESVDMLEEEGWAWDSESNTLILEDALLKQVHFNGISTVALYNNGDSLITTDTGIALSYEGKGCGLNILGEGTLTIETTNDSTNRVIVNSSTAGDLSIVSDSLVVNINSVKGYSYAAELYSGLIVTGGVELNINAPAGYGLHIRKDGYLSINNGAKLNIYTGYDNGIRLEENTTAHFEGKGTVVTLDTDSARSGDYAIDDNGNFLEVSDHAKVIIEKCRTNTTEELIFSNCELDVVGGILEFRAPGGESFPADKPMIRTQKDKLECNKHGMTNGYFKNLYGYDYLHIETAASTWIYKGDTPYIEFDKQPVNKYIVNGNTAVIDAEAKVVFGEEDQLATYQWYKDGVLIAGATASTYETEVMTDSSAEYYCIASATVDGVDISTKSDTIMVVANFSGKAVRTEALRLNAPGTVSEENEVEGWSWDNDKKILTLENYTHRMTDGTYGIDIPCGSTIILKGTNRIDMISSNAAIHAANGSGKVIVYGDGTLDITCPSNYGIYAEHGIDILGTVEIGNVRINNVLTGSTDIQSVYDSGLSIYKARIVADNEPGIILKDPEQKVFVASQGGVAPAISVAAELNGAAGPVSYQYQWYATDDWANPMENAVPVAKGAVLSAPVRERGGKYYYCEITATYNKKAYKKSTDLYAVVVGAKGLEPLTKKTRLSSDSVDHMSDQGWSYDADTYTLTLNNLEAFLPFGYNSSDFHLFEFYGAADKGIHIVLADDSVNHITESCYGLYCYNGNAIEFTGAGVLNYEAGPSGCQGLMFLRSTFASLDINGGAQLNVCGDGRWNAIENSEINITVSNAEATFDNLFSYSYGRNSSVHIAEGGVLNVIGAGEKEAKTVTVDNGGALYLSGSGNSLVIDRTSGTGTLNVSGILSITSDYAAITMVGADPETRINISDSVILTPDAKTVPGLYIRSSGDRHYYGEGNLLIAPSDFVRTDITGVPVITGEAKIGNTLTVGDVLPAGATVSYRWQYAVAKDTPDELWSDASSTDRTFVLDDIYAGKYIRVKVEGNGKYKGTVYSKPTLPVATSGVSIEDFVVEDIHYGRLSTNYSNYPPDLYYPTVIDGEIHVKALADDNNADITIKNITVGFDTKTEEEKTIQGSEGILPVYITGAINTNDIEITVTNGTEKAVYKTYIEYRVSTGTISLASGDSCALILKDKTDTEVLRADYLAKNKWHDFNAGEEYTLSAVSDLDGWYVSKIYSKDYPDCGELIAGERVAKITARNGKGLAFEIKDEDLRCIAPEARAFWNKTSVGYGIKAEWDSPLPTIYYGADHTGEISAALTDEDGNEVILTEKSVSNPQGFSGYFADFGFIVARDEAGNEITLDPAKSYILSLWYDAGDKEKCDVQKIIIPAMDMSMSNHHIVVEKPPYGDIAERTVNVNGRKFSVTTYPVMTDITVDAAEDGNYVIVRVYNSSEVGTTYALLHVRRPDGTVVSEPLIIDVVEPDTEVTAGLSAVSGSMNIYSEEMVTIPVNIIGSGKSIVSAKFVDSNNPAVSDKYLLNVFADREIEVKPVNTPDSDETDWAKVAKSYTGTFKARIELELEGGQVCTTQDYYTLKISASAPKVSAAAVKINSFYQNSSASIVFKTNATVTEANVDAVKTTAKLAACPAWLSLADNGKTLVLDNSKLINNKWSGKVYLKVWLAGYRMPVQVPVSVAVAYAAPKIKLDKATVTLPANHAKYYKYATISVISGDKKEAFSNLGITSVRVANPVELAALSAKDKQAYATSKYYKVRSYDAESGIIELDTYTASVGELPQMPAGKILLYAQVGDNSSQKIALPLTIKTVIDSKVTISMSKKSITLNSNKAVGSEVIDVNLVPSATCYDCRMATVTVTDTKGKGNYIGNLDIFFSGYDYHFATNSLTQPGTYRVNISVPGIAKPAVVDVIVKGVIPTLKADKKSVNIDAFGDYKEGKVQKTTLTLSDSTISRSAGDFSYKVYDSKRNRVDSELSVYFLGSSSEPIEAFIDANSSTKVGKYTVELIYTMPGSGVESVAKVSVNVSGKLPALKTSKVAVTLNSALRKSDMATVTFIKPDKYKYVGYSIEVLDKNNKPVYDVVVCDYDISDGILTMYPGTEAVAGQTYKVVVGNQVTGKINSEFVKNTITVKMATANKATGKPAISQKVITKGTLELARDGAKLDVIPSYGGWNMATAIGAVDIPEVTWAIYAYQNKKPYQYGDVLYQYAGDEGKVAASTPGGANEDWFIDVDPTDGISLVLNPSNRFVQEISDLTGLSYSLVVKTTFRNYYGAGEDMVLSTTSAFKVSVGTIKASVPKTSKIIMNKADRLDTKVIKINLIDKDALLYDLSNVKFSDDSIYEATLMYVGGDYAYVAIGWKNDTIPANVKSGKQTLELYAGHNYSGRAKANGTVVLAVDVN